MGDDFEQALPVIGAVAVIAVDLALTGGLSGVGFAAAAGIIAGNIAIGVSLGFIAQTFLVDKPNSPDFSPTGIGGSAGPRGTSSGGKSFASTGDGSFRRTDTSPQSPVPIVIGQYMVSGTLLDSFPLGENNNRLFSVVGIAKASIINVKTLVDNIDITTLPNFIDINAGGMPDDNKPWLQFVGNGGESGDIILANSGKKNLNIKVNTGQAGVTPDINFFKVVSGNKEARIFLSVDVPGVYVDTLETVNADYTSLTGLTLIITYMKAGQITDTVETVTFTDAMQTSSPDYSSLNGLTQTFTVDTVNRDVLMTGTEVDAATVAAKINTTISMWVTAVPSGNDVLIYNTNADDDGTITASGSAQAELNFVVLNDALNANLNINEQTTALTSTVESIDEIKFESDDPNNKRLKFSGTSFVQLNISQQNYGTVISYNLSKQKKRSAVSTEIFSDTNRSIEKVINGQAQKITLLTGLERLETSGAAFALAGLDLDVTVAGNVRTVTFTAGATDAATTAGEINDQIGAWVTATVIDTGEIRITTTTGGLSVSGAANAQLNFSVVDGDFFFDASIDSAGFWFSVLNVTKATNGASVNIAIVEVMSDFIKTEDGDFSVIADQTLILETNDGTLQTITFGGSTNTAAEAITDINDQLGTSVLATADGSEILVEALPVPVGTGAVAEIKQVKLIGGTASEDMNFKPLYSETKNYDYDAGYAIINLVRDSRISGNPQFTFEVAGASNNAAQNILDIFQGGSEYFGNGLNIKNEINRDSFINSIGFNKAESLEANTAFLDSSYGEAIQALLDAGSLMMFESGGIYNLIPETDSDTAAELHVTDDFKLDGIIKNSWSWSTIDDTRRFNVLRVIYPDAVEDYISRDIVIDVTGEVDTENNVEPRILENGELTDISDSEFDFLRTSTRNFPAVTSRAQALRLGRQIFKKQDQGLLAFSCSVSIRHTFLQRGDIVSLFIAELGFIGKTFRILSITESENKGFNLNMSEHFKEMYSF